LDLILVFAVGDAAAATEAWSATAVFGTGGVIGLGEDSFAFAGFAAGAATVGGATGVFVFAFGSGSFFGGDTTISATLSLRMNANP
jgi:hypothetical protein